MERRDWYLRLLDLLRVRSRTIDDIVRQAVPTLPHTRLSGSVKVVRPTPPDWRGWVDVPGRSVGKGEVDRRYEHSGGTTLVSVLHKKGDLPVAVES